MILVLLGTQNNSFHRLLEEIENCINHKIITDKVIVQAGHTVFESNNMEFLQMIPEADLNNLINQANLIITHGGVGSIINSIKLGKKVIAVPRLKKHHEHVNDHQLQIIESFDKQGLIKGVCDLTLLGDTIKNINDFIPKKYESNTQNFIKIISEYIENN